MVLALVVVSMVVALRSTWGLPDPSPPQWSGTTNINRTFITDGKRVFISGLLDVEMEGRFYLTRAAVSLKPLSVTVDGLPAADSGIYREQVRAAVRQHFDDPDCLPTPAPVMSMIDAAAEAPGTVHTRDFAEATRADSLMALRQRVIIIGTLAIVGCCVWLCVATMKKESARQPR